MSVILNQKLDPSLLSRWGQYPKPNSICPISNDDYEAGKEAFLNVGYKLSEHKIRETERACGGLSKDDFIKKHWEQTQINIQNYVNAYSKILFQYLDEGVPFASIEPELSEKVFSLTSANEERLTLVKALEHPLITKEDLNEILQNTSESCSAHASLKLVSMFKMNRKISCYDAIPFLKL